MQKEPKQIKLQAIGTLKSSVANSLHLIKLFDGRLLEYLTDLCEHSSVNDDDPDDLHNCDEILGAVKFVRLLNTYVLDPLTAQQMIYVYEGEWRKDGKIWRHVKDGLLHPSLQGKSHYRLQPYQVYVLICIFGLKYWSNTQVKAENRELIPSEQVREDGYIWDLRRMCSEFVLFTPRKTAKTQFSAFIQFCFFFFGDYNSECYCCANSEDQSKILFSRTRDLIAQHDPDKQYLRITETEVTWKRGKNQVLNSSLTSLSAGGKTKDGLFGQLCSADEYGSAAYVKGKSDMGRLVSVVESSMGPRREPLTFITTTAGTITTGPFIDKLQGIQRMLQREIDIAEGKAECTTTDDRHMCLLLHPDEWERNEDYLLTSVNVRAKINPMLGIIVQHAFYEDEIAKARTDGPDKLNDVISKDFNTYRNGALQEWLTSADIRPLQCAMRVDECTQNKGWIVFVGSDFSKGSDLNGNGYLCYNLNSRQFFCDGDFYISEEAVNKSSIKELYNQWASKGYLHITSGGTFDPAAVVSRIVELHNKGVNFALFGYDKYNSKLVINALSAWVFDLGVQLGTTINPDDIIISVSQSFATYNPLVNEFDYLVKRTIVNPATGKVVNAPLVSFSDSPLWGWLFDNCVLAESADGYGNRKPLKRNSSDSCKIDGVQMLLTGLYLFDRMNGKENEVGE